MVVPQVLLFQIDNTVPMLIAVFALIVAVGCVYSSITIVDDHEKHALTVFGAYRKLLDPGTNFVPPFVSQTYTFDLRTRTVEIPPQEVIADDDSFLTASGIVSLRVIDAEKAFLQVEDHERAVSNLSQTALRAVLIEMGSNAIHNRPELEEQIRRDLSPPGDEWGVRIESVEIQDVQQGQKSIY